MASTIKIKNSSTAGAAPTTSDLVQGELAVNVTDKKIYTKNASGTIVKIGDTPSITDNGNAEAIVIDSSENVGLGVTPSSWRSTYNALQIGIGGALFGRTATQDQVNVSANYYVNTSNVDTYIGTGYATLYKQTSGQHQWYYAPTTGSGAGNAITFTQAMTLDASGNLGIGATSINSMVHLRRDTSSGSSTSYPNVRIDNPNAAGYSGLYFYQGATGIAGLEVSNAASALQFIGTGGTERARIDSSGNLLVGTTSAGGTGTTMYRVASGNAGAPGAIYFNGSSASTETVMGFQYNGTTVGSITRSTTATAYVTSSDYRLKDITGGLTGYKERLSALQPKQGFWKIDGSEFRGFLAHEFAAAYPTSVSGEKDAVDENGNPKYQGMQAGSPEVIADLVAYIKELENRLFALEQA